MPFVLLEGAGDGLGDRGADLACCSRRAKEAGATGILLTSYRDTPVSRLADIELLVATPGQRAWVAAEELRPSWAATT
jgi:DNA-binding MurR/RpiR family transcriptional regulator